MLEKGQLSSIIGGIRAETEMELLDQAVALLASSHQVSAAMLAGGALETHLSGLCSAHELTPPGTGSISKYDAAIAQARNAGNVIYNTTDSKNVTAWGGLRNEAAHEPTKFSRSAEEVRLMISGIRDFIARCR
jgi:hypothetical protein